MYWSSTRRSSLYVARGYCEMRTAAGWPRSRMSVSAESHRPGDLDEALERSGEWLARSTLSGSSLDVYIGAAELVVYLLASEQAITAADWRALSRLRMRADDIDDQSLTLVCDPLPGGKEALAVGAPTALIDAVRQRVAASGAILKGLMPAFVEPLRASARRRRSPTGLVVAEPGAVASFAVTGERPAAGIRLTSDAAAADQEVSRVSLALGAARGDVALFRMQTTGAVALRACPQFAEIVD